MKRRRWRFRGAYFVPALLALAGLGFIAAHYSLEGVRQIQGSSIDSLGLILLLVAFCAAVYLWMTGS